MTEDNSCTCDPELIALSNAEERTKHRLQRMAQLQHLSSQVTRAIETLCTDNNEVCDHFVDMLGNYCRYESEESDDPSTWKGPGALEHLNECATEALCFAAYAYAKSYDAHRAYWDRPRPVKDHDSESGTVDPSRN